MFRLMLPLALLSACGGSAGWAPEQDVTELLVEIASAADGLSSPQDLAFNPDRPDELWVVNKRDDSVTLVFDASTEDRTTRHVVDPYALHFMDRVSSIAFGAPGTFGTCQDSTNTYNGAGPDNTFMGPTLWSSDLEVFGTSNPEAVAFLSDQFGMPVDLGSHLDMLHESPECVGIDWEAANVYWVFDGSDGSLVRYDFHEDHGVGYDDHSDGEIARYVTGELERVNGAVGHVALDRSTNLLYAVDTGHARVVVLDTRTGTRGRDLPVEEPGTDHYRMDDAVLTELIAAEDGLVQPAGLELIDGHLVITDRGTGHVLIFTLSGEKVADLDTGLGAGCLAGIAGDTLDDLWLADADRDVVWRLRP